MISSQTHKDAQPPGTPPQLVAVLAPWERLPLPTLVTVPPSGALGTPTGPHRFSEASGFRWCCRSCPPESATSPLPPAAPSEVGAPRGRTAGVAGDHRKRSSTKESAHTRVRQGKASRQVQRGSRAPGLPGTPSPALPEGSSGWVRAERAGRAVGEEPPEPVLDARLDARLELTLGARG